MRSSEAASWIGLVLALGGVLVARDAAAQTQPKGFAVERFYPSAPGAGWFVMDTLDMHGGLGGAMSLTTGYAARPLRVSSGAQDLAVVSDEAFASFSAAATYDRFRGYLDLPSPLVIDGQTGTVAGRHFVAPAVNPANDPDLLSDARVGIDMRILGEAESPVRAGLSGQLYLPSGDRSDYDTDGAYRGMARFLVAGEVGRMTFAGHVGVHVRPLDDRATPGSPRGSELLFGLAAGPRIAAWSTTRLVVGAEVYGETAFASFFGDATTGLEALLSGRLEGTGDDGAKLRFKWGIGGGLHPQFGAPEGRFLIGIELFRATHR